ncbi:hypothetical protein PQX77_015567 [Marasmius sp. AFHP31]|nr:hypothetical protein PQX77_015567 [Marasmius sp. AFHP31]
MSNQARLVVLIAGATGYVGGNVLYRLLNLPNARSRYEFRAIVRDADKARKLGEFGVKAIVCSLSDANLVEREVSEANVILAVADSDDLAAAEAINKGMKKRFEKTGEQPILIHTSGTGVLIDRALGEYASDDIFDDGNLAHLEAIPFDALHRQVELKVISADEEGYAKTYIVAPSIIYNVARNPLVDAGVSSSRTMLCKVLAPTSIKRGRGIAIGKGENIWLHVHIDELTDFYELLFTSVLDQSRSGEVPHGKAGYFCIGAEEVKLHQLYKEVSRILFDTGKIQSAESTQFTEEEAAKYFGPHGIILRTAFGGNSRFIGTKAKTLGWRPRKTTEDCLGSLKEEIELLARETSSQ